MRRTRRGLAWAGLLWACAAPEAGPIDGGAGGDGGSADDGAMASGCGACHGSGENPAPPPDLSGSYDRARPGVGAHAEHLRASDRRSPVKCMHCHAVPAAGDASHGRGGGPARVAFSGLAAARGTSSYEGGTCAVYCHGRDGFGAPPRSPAWTSVGPLECDACHALPPPSPHPPASDCARCHPGVIDAQGRITSPSRHVDGVCAAPKGAHLVHISGAGGPDFACTRCHVDGAYLLRDHGTLETTTVCDPCHRDAQRRKEEWPSWRPH